MSLLATLFQDQTPYFQWPPTWIGWLGWLFFLAGLVYLGWRWRDARRPWGGRELVVLGGALVLEVIASLFVGIRLPTGGALPAPGLPVSPSPPAVMVFAALPWVLAAGLLGTPASLALAALSGGLLALFDTHDPFQPLVYGVMGAVLGAALNQRYRTPFYRVLRHPLIAGLILMILYPVFFIFGTMLGLEGALPVLLDFALARTGVMAMAFGIPLILACVVGEVLAVGVPTLWGKQGKMVPSPAEKSLETRSFYLLGPVVGLMVLALTAVVWVIAANIAQDFVKSRMEEAASVAAESLPYTVEIGQSTILELASDQELLQADQATLSDILSQQLLRNPFFSQLLVVGRNGEVVASAKSSASDLISLERSALSFAFEGVPFQYYVIERPEVRPFVELSFIAGIKDQDQSVGRVLIGRSDFESNPFTSAVITGLESVVDLGGAGMLISDQGKVLYHTDSNLILTTYEGKARNTALFDTETGPTGTRNIVYYQPVRGKPWTIIVSVPAQAVQQKALTIATPLFGILFVVAVVLMALLRVTLRLVTRSLRRLAFEATNIAQNQAELARPLVVGGEDEIGQMRRAFERMRVSLQNHLDEQRRALLNAEIERQRLAAILASTPDPVLVTDAKNHLLLANPAAWQVFGDGSAIELGIPIEEAVSQEAIISLLKAPVDDLQTEEVIEEVELPDGKVYVAKATSVMAENQLMGRVCVLRDVTRFKEIDALKSDFVSTVSHDLRSPLTLIRGYATMLQMVGHVNEDQSKYIRKILHGVDRMSQMVNNLLDLGRIEAGIGLKLEMIPVQDTVQQVISSLRFQADEKNITLNVQYPSTALPLIEADPSLLQQALHNLVENAIKYTDPGGQVLVTVKIQPYERKLLFEVQDTGIGISPADQLRLFEKFYRVPNRKTSKQRGSGLGLAIVKSIVEAHHGRVWVESEYGKGSTFFIEMPLRQDMVGQPQQNDAFRTKD